MTADQASADDHEDAAFRARLAPLAAEVLPGAAKLSAVTNEPAARPKARRRLARRAAIAREASVAVASPAPSRETEGRPSRPDRLRAAVLAGMVIAIGAGSVAWLYPRWTGHDKPAIGKAFTAITGAPGKSSDSSASTITAVPPHTTFPPDAAPALPGSTRDAREDNAAPPAASVRAEETDALPGTANSPTVAHSTNEGSIPPTGNTAWPPPVESGTPAVTPVPAAGSLGDAAGAPDRGPESSLASPSGAMIALLLRRGEAAIAVGDIIAARLLYERAAALGSATAATAAGKTYDIDFLLRAGARGIPADPIQAAAWFRKGAVLGDLEARSHLERIEARSRR